MGARIITSTMQTTWRQRFMPRLSQRSFSLGGRNPVIIACPPTRNIARKTNIHLNALYCWRHSDPPLEEWTRSFIPRVPSPAHNRFLHGASLKAWSKVVNSLFLFVSTDKISTASLCISAWPGYMRLSGQPPPPQATQTVTPQIGNTTQSWVAIY